jgi:hypothetical protein
MYLEAGVNFTYMIPSNYFQNWNWQAMSVKLQLMESDGDFQDERFQKVHVKRKER